MSIHPPLSESKNAQPAPVVSGKYFSGDFPLECTQRIPLFPAGISSKGYGAASGSRNSPQRGPSNAPAATPDRKSRGVSLGQRLLLRIFAVPRVYPCPGEFPQRAQKTEPLLLRFIAWQWRRSLRRQATVNLKLFLRCFLVPGPAQRRGE